jgi:hypothetical protein
MVLGPTLAALFLFTVLVPIGFVLFAVFLSSAHEWAVYYRLEQVGVSIDGEVTDRYVKHRGRGNAHYITYSFPYGAQAKRYHREEEIYPRNYRRWVKGTPTRCATRFG